MSADPQMPNEMTKVNNENVSSTTEQNLEAMAARVWASFSEEQREGNPAHWPVLNDEERALRVAQFKALSPKTQARLAYEAQLSDAEKAELREAALRHIRWTQMTEAERAEALDNFRAGIEAWRKELLDDLRAAGLPASIADAAPSELEAFMDLVFGDGTAKGDYTVIRSDGAEKIARDADEIDDFVWDAPGDAWVSMQTKDKDSKLLEQAAIAVSIDAVEDCPLPPSIVLRHVGNDDLFAVFFLASAVELQKWQLPAELTGKAPLPGSGSWVIAKISANRMYEIGELVKVLAPGVADTTIAEPIVGPSAPPIEPEKLEERRRLEGEARKHIRSFKHDADAKQHNIGTYRMALQFASHGLRVIPVHSINPDGSCTCDWAAEKRAKQQGKPFVRCTSPGKHPRGFKWQEDATDNLERIEAYWDGFGPKKNVGIVFGSATRNMVVDVDGEIGKTSLAKWEAEHGLPPTVTVITGSGGLHLYYRVPEGWDIRNSVSTVADKIDIRGENGFCVGPASLHKSGYLYQCAEGRSPDEIDQAVASIWLLRKAFFATKDNRHKVAPDGSRFEDAGLADVEGGTPDEPATPSTTPGRRRTPSFPSMSPRKAAANARLDAVARSLNERVGWEHRIPLIGHGPGLLNFNTQIYSAACSYFGSFGWGADDTALIAALVERIAVAPSDPPDHRNAYLDNGEGCKLRLQVEAGREYVKGKGAPEHREPLALPWPSMDQALKELKQAAKADDPPISDLERLVLARRVGAMMTTSKNERTILLGEIATKKLTLTKLLQEASSERNRQRTEPPDMTTERMNKMFAVFEGNTKVEVLKLMRAPGNLPPQYDLNNFLATKEGRRVVGYRGSSGDIPIRAGDVWLDDVEYRHSVNSMVFAPPGAPEPDEDAFNIWNGFPELKDMSDLDDLKLESLCNLFLTHIYEEVCRADDNAFHYYLDWWADIFQKPGQLVAVAMAIVGGFGSGKTTLWRALRPALGDWMLKMSTKDQKTGNFNEHKVCKLIHVSEETAFAGDKAVANMMKDEITSDELLVNPKFRSAFVVSNYARQLYLANDVKQAVSMAEGDRRFTVFESSDRLSKLWANEATRPQQVKYFNNLYGQMKGDGLAAFVELLRRREYDQDRLRHPLPTAAKRTMLQAQLNPAQRWLVDAVTFGEFSGGRNPVDTSEEMPALKLAGDDAKTKVRGGKVKVILLQKHLSVHFAEAMKAAPERWVRAEYGTASLLGGFLVDYMGAERPEPSRIRHEGGNDWGWYVDPLSEVRANLIKRGLMEPVEALQPPEPTEQQLKLQAARQATDATLTLLQRAKLELRQDVIAPDRMLALSSALERLSGRLWDERHFVDLVFGGPDDAPEIEGDGEWVEPETKSVEPPEPDDIPF